MVRHKIHWLCWQPTPYNAHLFRSLAAEPAIDLTVHFREPLVSTHPWKTDCRSGYDSRIYRTICKVDWHVIGRALKDRSNFFVIAVWNEPTAILLINLLMAQQHPFAIWTDTPRVHGRGSSVKGHLRNGWLRSVFHRASFVLGTGLPALNALQEIGCPPDKLVNFPYFIDLDAFSPDTNFRSHQQIVFASSGRLVNGLKGYDLALRALGRSLKLISIERSNVAYRIAGTGPDRSSLETTACDAGVSDLVEFAGWLELGDLPTFYRQSTVFLHPARYEPYGVAVLEAMASGLAVISSDAAGSARDRIIHGKNGLLHHSDDIESLTAHITWLLENPNEITELGRNARQTAEQWPVSRGTELLKKLVEQHTQD